MVLGWWTHTFKFPNKTNCFKIVLNRNKCVPQISMSDAHQMKRRTLEYVQGKINHSHNSKT